MKFGANPSQKDSRNKRAIDYVPVECLEATFRFFSGREGFFENKGDSRQIDVSENGGTPKSSIF